jgi:hypothetical protein
MIPLARFETLTVNPAWADRRTQAGWTGRAPKTRRHVKTICIFIIWATVCIAIRQRLGDNSSRGLRLAAEDAVCGPNCPQAKWQRNG